MVGFLFFGKIQDLWGELTINVKFRLVPPCAFMLSDHFPEIFHLNLTTLILSRKIFFQTANPLKIFPENIINRSKKFFDFLKPRMKPKKKKMIDYQDIQNCMICDKGIKEKQFKNIILKALARKHNTSVKLFFLQMINQIISQGKSAIYINYIEISHFDKCREHFQKYYRSPSYLKKAIQNY